MKPRRIHLWIGGVLLLAGALGAAKAGRIALGAYRAEAKTFMPERGPVPRPEVELSVELSDVEYALSDGTRIRGWYLPSRNGAAVVFAHGSPGDRSSALVEAKALTDAGYGALLIDLPGHGESTGSASWGPGAVESVRNGLDYLRSRREVDGKRLGAFGYSMGGCTIAQVAAADARVAAVVLVATFTNLEDQLGHEFGRRGFLTHRPAVWAARRAGVPVDEMRPADVIDQIAPRPLLIIHGSEDSAVPASMAHELHDKAREPKSLWLVEGAGHVDLARVAGRAYPERLVEFFDRALIHQTSAPDAR